MFLVMNKTQKERKKRKEERGTRTSKKADISAQTTTATGVEVKAINVPEI